MHFATSIFVLYQILLLVKLLLMIYCKAVLLFTRLQDFISILIIGVLSFTITPIFTFSSEMQ